MSKLSQMPRKNHSSFLSCSSLQPGERRVTQIELLVNHASISRWALSESPQSHSPFPVLFFLGLLIFLLYCFLNTRFKVASNSPCRGDPLITKVVFPRTRLTPCTLDVLTPKISPMWETQLHKLW